MEESRYKFIYIYVIITAFLLSAALFTFFNLYNNKYTHSSVQPISGIVYLDKGDTDNTAYLINQWAYYENELLTPYDFSENMDMYTQYVSIGEYSSMHTYKKGTPFGSGTYSLRLILPEKEDYYSLYIPEIFSSYNLYIDNELALAMGDPAKGIPSIGNRIVTFRASGDTRLIFAVNDESSIYSGMVYPPAIGSPRAISSLNSRIIFINSSILMFLMLCFVLSIYTGVKTGERTTYIFALLSLCTAEVVSYPAIHTFFTVSSNVCYIIEIFSSYFMYALIIIIQNRLIKPHRSIRLLSFAAGAVMCIFSLIYSLSVPYIPAETKAVLSSVFSYYKWAVLIYIISTDIYAFLKERDQTLPLLFGTVFFASSLVFDRLYSLYEPIYAGRFTETGAIVMILSLACVYWRHIIQTYKKGITFEDQRKFMEKQINIQKENYINIKDKIETTKKLSHDFRHHIYVMKEYIKNREYDKLSQYISSIGYDFNVSEPVEFCSNTALNALLHYYSSLCEKYNIDININVSFPRSIPVNDTDISIIAGNLIENAFEAASKTSSAGTRYINIYGKGEDSQFVFKIENSFEGSVSKKGNRYFSSKRNDYGIGIDSVTSVVEKYKGIIEISHNDNIFTVSLILFY